MLNVIKNIIKRDNSVNLDPTGEYLNPKPSFVCQYFFYKRQKSIVKIVKSKKKMGKKSNIATCYELCEHILTQAVQWRPAVSTNYVVGPLPAREARFQKHKLFQGKPQWLYYTLGSGRTCGFAFIWESREVPHPEHRPASPWGATRRLQHVGNYRINELQVVSTLLLLPFLKKSSCFWLSTWKFCSKLTTYRLLWPKTIFCRHLNMIIAWI